MNGINIWAVLVAAVASFALGALWYSPALFLKPWSREAGVNPEAPIANPGRVYGLTFVLTLLTSLALAILLGPQPQLDAALATGAGTGICLVATSMGINYQFANRNLLLWAIDSGFHVVRLLVMGVVLGLWH